MRVRSTNAIALAHAALFAAALLAGDAYAQGTRATTGGSRTGSMRQNYQTGQNRGQLPFSGSVSGAGGGQQNGGLGGQAGLGGDATREGPMSAGLANPTDAFQPGGFVGRDAQDVQRGFDSLSGRQGPGMMMDMMIENLNEMRDARRRWREQNAAPPPIRVRLQPAFDVPVIPPAQAAADIQLRLMKVMQIRGVGSAQVEVAGRTVVLRGVVPTERDRALVDRLASLEPGVSRVENLVTVQAGPVQQAPPR